ncbi:MAG: serine/threonine protein kinase [Deltaproteobacteria bacterium]|nr:serine/threonine protein kinase [Deltaproteobacteria bacterium]
MIGRVIGKCKIESRLGSGAMGDVYKGRHLTLNVPVAVKTVRPEWAHDRSLLARFLREAQLAARLRHPNLVRVYDVGREEDLHYIVMEFLDGTPLDEHFARSAPLAPERFFRVFHALGQGLGEAHRAGIVHRDVKPGNVILVDGERPVLTDFGIAAALANDFRLTVPGNVLGTPAYMSPEQARGERQVDSRSDVFALGVMMAEAASGRLPQEDDSTLELLRRRAMERLPRLRDLAPSFPEPLARVVDRSVDPDRELRWTDGRQLAEGLAAAWRELNAGEAAATAPTSPSLRPVSRASARVLSLPTEESTALTDGLDPRFADPFALFAAVEGSPTGFGLLVRQDERLADVLLFAQGQLRAAFRWQGDERTPIDFAEVLRGFEGAAPGTVDAWAVPAETYDMLKAVLLRPATIRGLRSGFVELPALFEHLARERSNGVLAIRRDERVGLVRLRGGVPAKVLCGGLRDDNRCGSWAVTALVEALAPHPDARLDFHPDGDAVATAPPGGVVSPLEPAAAQVLVDFVREALQSSGAALERQFGLGTRPILERHLRLAAEVHPRVLAGIELEVDHAPGETPLLERIQALPWTGRRTLVTDAFVAVVRERLQAIAGALPAGRKANKVLSDAAAVFARHRPRLAESGFDERFAGLFAPPSVRE